MVQGGEQGLEEKIIQGNKAASSPQMAPASQSCWHRLQVRNPVHPMHPPWAPGGFDSQRFLPQTAETGFVLSHFPTRNCCKKPNGYHYFCSKSLLHYFVRDRMVHGEKRRWEK